MRGVPLGNAKEGKEKKKKKEAEEKENRAVLLLCFSPPSPSIRNSYTTIAELDTEPETHETRKREKNLRDKGR